MCELNEIFDDLEEGLLEIRVNQGYTEEFIKEIKRKIGEGGREVINITREGHVFYIRYK